MGMGDDLVELMVLSGRKKQVIFVDTSQDGTAQGTI